MGKGASLRVSRSRIPVFSCSLIVSLKWSSPLLSRKFCRSAGVLPAAGSAVQSPRNRSPATQPAKAAALKEFGALRLGCGSAALRQMSVEETCQGTRGTGSVELRNQTDLVGVASGFNRLCECQGHTDWIGGDRDRRVDKHGIGAEFHCFGRVAGRAETGVHDDRHRGLLDDNANLVTSLYAAVGTDG